MSMVEIQKELNAPKGQRNNFGNYNYRSCEDILEAVKPLLEKHGYHLILSDEIVEVGGRVYVRSTASVYDTEKLIQSASAFAREPLDQKGMQVNQITGATSSYSRKYALNGLFAIDDAKDSDTDEHKNQSDNNPDTHEDDEKPWFNDSDLEKHTVAMLAKIASKESTADEIVKNLRKTFKVSNQMAGKIKSLELNGEAAPH